MRAEGKDHMSEQKKSLDVRAEGKDHMSETKGSEIWIVRKVPRPLLKKRFRSLN
jgi:hypothetical protein